MQILSFLFYKIYFIKLGKSLAKILFFQADMAEFSANSLKMSAAISIAVIMRAAIRTCLPTETKHNVSVYV